MDPLNLQKQIRNNSDDLLNFCSELKQWGEEMKNKDAALKTGYNLDDVPKSKPIVTKPAKTEKVEKPKSKSKKRIKASDYTSWEKFDVEAECAKLDEEHDADSGDLTDEIDEDAHDQAVYEKEKGNDFVKNQKWDQAISCYTTAIGQYAYDPIFYANRALCYLKTEKYKEAECDCTSALQLDKTYVKAYQRRAAAREALNQLNEARSDLLKVFDYEPNNKESKNALSKLEKKLEGTNNKPKVESQSQRPKSKFTMSQQKKRTITKTTKEYLNLDQEIPKSDTYWASGNEIELIEAINKSPHLRSKKPLRRIPIESIDSTDSGTEFDELVRPWPCPGSDNKIINCDNLKIVERKSEDQIRKDKDRVEINLKPEVEDTKLNKTVDVEISPPTNCIQFTSDWRLLENNKDLRYKYLKQIDPRKIPVLFKESVDCDVFSGILHTLSESFVENNDCVYEYLVKLSEVKRFSMLKMFMTNSDKEDISKLFAYMSSSSHLMKNKIDDLISKYAL
ncbi:hypothetical protein RN001_000531 [Aquatica leii]|uniref:RNA polymerase II-associated protein 3 n=1 Tax=Aquatica leii TaxID=1421715 RepID=A0AAN7PA44_9COLE|nr:hypothetical protein RN001_000531 [Aquatica leii]